MIQLFDAFGMPINRGDILLMNNSAYNYQKDYKFGVAFSIDDRKRNLRLHNHNQRFDLAYSSDDRVNRCVVFNDYYEDLVSRSVEIKDSDALLDLHRGLQGTEWPELYPQKTRQLAFWKKWVRGFTRCIATCKRRAMLTRRQYWYGGEGQASSTFRNKHNYYTYTTEVALGEYTGNVIKGGIPKRLVISVRTGRRSKDSTVVLKYDYGTLNTTKLEIDGYNLLEVQEVKDAINQASQDIWNITIL